MNEERIAELEKRIENLEKWNFHGSEKPNLTKWDKKQKENEHG